MGINLAKIQATRNAEAKDAEMQRDAEIQRAQTELERRRATDLVHAKIDRESAQQKADAKFYAENDSPTVYFKNNDKMQSLIFLRLSRALMYLCTNKSKRQKPATTEPH